MKPDDSDIPGGIVVRVIAELAMIALAVIVGAILGFYLS